MRLIWIFLSIAATFEGGEASIKTSGWAQELDKSLREKEAARQKAVGEFLLQAKKNKSKIGEEVERKPYHRDKSEIGEQERFREKTSVKKVLME